MIYFPCEFPFRIVRGEGSDKDYLLYKILPCRLRTTGIDGAESNEESLKGFKQRSDMIRFALWELHSSCIVENRLEGAVLEVWRPVR